MSNIAIKDWVQFKQEINQDLESLSFVEVLNLLNKHKKIFEVKYRQNKEKTGSLDRILSFDNIDIMFENGAKTGKILSA